MARDIFVLCVLAYGLVVPRANAANGTGFFSISLSNDVEFLDVTAVDPNTLLPLSDTFTANTAGEYFLEGLVVLDGDTANPIGDFQISGQGDPELQSKFRWIIEQPFKPPGLVLFASLISGITIEEPPINSSFEHLRALASIAATGDPGTPPVDPTSYATIFLQTADGKSANAVDAGVGGTFAIPGTTNFDSGVVNLPDLPADTTEDHYSELVIQNDIGLFNVVESLNLTLTSTAHAHILPSLSGIPGDYNNDGIVNAADYTVWRNHLGQEFALPNEDPDNMDGVVTQADYDYWVQHFGDVAPSAGSGSAASTRRAAVPEPASGVSFVIVAVLIAAVCSRCRTEANQDCC